MGDIVTTLITASASVFASVLTLMGVIITNSKSNKQLERRLEIAQAVTDTKIDELTREVRLHNNFARRVPVIEEQIKVVNHRVADLELGG